MALPTEYRGWNVYHYVNPEQWMATLPPKPPHYLPRLPVLRAKTEAEIKKQIDDNENRPERN
jgi:hypothetical protein